MIVGHNCLIAPFCPVILENVTVAFYWEIPHLLWSSNVNDSIHRIWCVLILSSATLVIFLLSYLFQIQFNIMLPFTFTSSKWFISLNVFLANVLRNLFGFVCADVLLISSTITCSAWKHRVPQNYWHSSYFNVKKN